MQWMMPPQNKSEVNRAGQILARAWSFKDKDNFPENYNWEGFTRSWMIASTWRSAHGYPLNHMQNLLRHKVRSLRTGGCIVAQRLKRMSSIIEKLGLENTMDLAQMQDIGGCRAILRDVTQVERMVKAFESSRFAHQLHNKKDYIANPKGSGYRGVHLVYRFSGGEMKRAYNGLRIEIQIRTRPQHIWAMAVESIGAITKQALKKSLGGDDWKRYFALVGTIIAMREKSPMVPNTPETLSGATTELWELERKLQMRQMLSAVESLPEFMIKKMPGAYYFLIVTDFDTKETNVRGFERGESKQAEEAYTQIEWEIRNNPSKNAVLVSVASLEQLMQAYPSYYLDTDAFQELLAGILK